MNEYEKKVALTLEDTKKQFLDILTKQKTYLSNNQVIALFLALNDKVQQIKDKEKRKRILAVLATAAAMYIYYNTMIKGGLVIFTIFSMSITVFNFNIWMNKQASTESENTNVSSVSDSLNQIKMREKFVADSLQKVMALKQKEDSLAREQEISDSLLQFQIIEEDENCYYLAKKGSYVMKLIEEDNKNHKAENYFVNLYDHSDKYFLVLKSFDDLREVAFQRKHLLDNGFSKSKIIELKDDKYGLSIYEFTATKYEDILSELYNWEQFCDDDKYKLTIYHNGMCKLQ